jgi:sporulation related protein
MADHRKFFRPRRLAFGGRRVPHACFLAISLALFNLAYAEDAGLKNGATSLVAGKYDAAVRQFSATINADNVAPPEAAKALYLRGIAYRKLNQPSRAIADFGAAMWLGLPEGDRVKALVNRGLAYQSAGLAKAGEADIALARNSGSGEVDQLIAEGGGSAEGAASIAAFSTSVTPGSQGPNAQAAATPAAETPARTASASGQWTTSASAETAEGSSSGSRVSRWWGSLTGSSSSEQPAASAPPETAAPTSAPAKPPSAPSTGWGAQTQAGEAAAAASTPSPAPSSGWGAQTQQTPGATVPTSPPPAASSSPKAPSTGWGAQTQGGETVVASDASPSQSRWSRWFSKSAEAEAPAAPAAAAAPATPSGGGFQLQLANSRSEAEARALWKRVSSENQEVAGAQPAIEKVDIGNFGTFYSLKIGPFPDKSESLKVCNALKRNAVDCSLVTQ